MQKALNNYFKILEKKDKPKFKKLSKEEFNKKIKDAFEILENCEFCERKCKVNRLKGQLGFCRAANKIEISSYFEHLGEEYFFIPSFTIFFLGCTFSCQFCQNWTISQRIEKGTVYNEKELAEIIDEHSHCKNVNFVGGDPTPYLPFILKILKLVKANIPVVWNSNFYMSEKAMDLLNGIVDVYLSDFKYGNNKCAERLSKVKNYFDIVSRNHVLALKDSELVIRHLVMPNHFECCTKKIFDFIANKLGKKAVINIMDQYRPQYMAHKYPEINRRLTAEEFKKAVDYAEKVGLNFIT